MAPLDVGLHDPEGQVTDRYIDFLVERARGETSLIITEFTSVWPEQRVITTAVWDDKFVPGLTRMAEAVKAAGSKIFMQIAVLGGKSYVEPFAPSAIESELYTEVPREMTVDDIKRVIEAFILESRAGETSRFRRSGVSLCTFLSRWTVYIAPHKSTG